MNLIKFIKANDNIVREIRFTFKRLELNRDEVEEFREFLKTSIAKGLDDYKEFETLLLLIDLFCFKEENHTDYAQKKPKPGRPKKDTSS